jgi:hypothetical protein
MLVGLIVGKVHIDWALGAVGLSGSLAGFVFIRRHALFENFADPVNRLYLRAAFIAGGIVGVLAILLGGFAVISLLGAICLAFWGFLFLEYRENQELFIEINNGRAFKNTWLSVDAAYIRPGDLILTSGVIGPRVGMSVDHGELALRNKEGAMVCLSSHWQHGAVLNPLLKVTKGAVKNGPYYVARPNPELNERQANRLFEIALEMIEENGKWRAEEEVRRTRWINSLWLPQSMKERLLKKFLPDGYDWFGLVIGRRRKHCWTCIGACVEAYARLSKEEAQRGITIVKLRKYGVGLFGLGTGFCDPICPIRVATDPALRILDTNDQTAHNAALEAAAQAAGETAVVGTQGEAAQVSEGTTAVPVEGETARAIGETETAPVAVARE